MSLQKDLDWIHKEIDAVKDVSILEKIKTILKSNKLDNQKESIDQYNSEIDIAINQVKEDQTISHHDLGKKVKSWLKK